MTSRSCRYCQTVNIAIAGAAIDKLKNHLWYLSKDLVSLGFLDVVDANEKQKMVEALKKPAGKKELRNAEFKTITYFHTIGLSDFVTIRSLNLFQSLHIHQFFLTITHRHGISMKVSPKERKLLAAYPL